MMTNVTHKPIFLCAAGFLFSSALPFQTTVRPHGFTAAVQFMFQTRQKKEAAGRFITNNVVSINIFLHIMQNAK